MPITAILSPSILSYLFSVATSDLSLYEFRLFGGWMSGGFLSCWYTARLHATCTGCQQGSKVYNRMDLIFFCVHIEILHPILLTLNLIVNMIAARQSKHPVLRLSLSAIAKYVFLSLRQ